MLIVNKTIKSLSINLYIALYEARLKLREMLPRAILKECGYRTVDTRVMRYVKSNLTNQENC